MPQATASPSSHSPSVPPTPRSTGPTRDAQPISQPQPTLPNELRNSEFTSFVRVRFTIAADGSFQVSLISTSGNPKVDARVLDAMKRWKWKPAMKNGAQVASVRPFRIEIEVN